MSTNYQKRLCLALEPSNKCGQIVPATTLQFIFNSLTQPHFDYCSVVWDNCSTTLADKLKNWKISLCGESFQLTFSSYDTSADPVIQSLGCPEETRNPAKIKKAVLVYKSLHGLAPGYLCSMFKDCMFKDRSSITNCHIPVWRILEPSQLCTSEMVRDWTFHQH